MSTRVGRGVSSQHRCRRCERSNLGHLPSRTKLVDRDEASDEEAGRKEKERIGQAVRCGGDSMSARRIEKEEGGSEDPLDSQAVDGKHENDDEVVAREVARVVCDALQKRKEGNMS